MNRTFPLLFLVVVSTIYARIYEPSNRNAFWSQINKSGLAVVQLYCCDKSSCKQDAHFLKNRLKAISQNNRFSYVKLDFINFNYARSPEILKEFSIDKSPAIILCINGVPLPGALIGFVKEPEIVRFIENNMGKEIDAVVAQKDEYQQQLQEAKLAAYANCCYGYPYWFWYGPGCGWNGAWGCGWRGCCW